MRQVFVSQLSMWTGIIWFCCGCSVQVKTYQKATADVSAYRTWCWMKGCEIDYQGPDAYYDKRVLDEIANAIASNLSGKGYIQGDESSDFILNFYTLMELYATEALYPYQTSYQEEDEWLTSLYSKRTPFLKT